jgi:hypothetical protein
MGHIPMIINETQMAYVDGGARGCRDERYNLANSDQGRRLIIEWTATR